jgi:hypothetical protein
MQIYRQFYPGFDGVCNTLPSDGRLRWDATSFVLLLLLLLLLLFTPLYRPFMLRVNCFI